MVENSTTTGVNVAQLVGRHDGTLDVRVYDWSSFLTEYFRPLPGIKKYHHFRFSKDEPGVVYSKLYSDSEEVRFMLLKDINAYPPMSLPTEIKPTGLDENRQNYLYKEIRQFCRPGTEDIVCPKPVGAV